MQVARVVACLVVLVPFVAGADVKRRPKKPGPAQKAGAKDQAPTPTGGGPAAPLPMVDGKTRKVIAERIAAIVDDSVILISELDQRMLPLRTDAMKIADVDERILQVFTEAYADVEREFREVFSALFPGGEGRLLLTDPDDMLTTGIEVEARPPGKKIKRLSLLSGGEKSLTAVAMLVAIFRARPSPFYVMDEVEAALDDVNLRRLLGLFEQLRAQSQLIVITHQKPTMEVADALYGVTMRDDGITQVISQRMRGQELVGASR